MQVGSRISVLFSQAKVDDVDLRAASTNTHQEIVGFNIPVDEAAGVDVFDSANELVCQKQDSLVGKLTVAVVEKVLKRRAQEVDHHGVVVAFSSVPSNKRNAYTAAQGLVNFGFVFQLWVLSFDVFQLDGDLFTRDDVCSEINVTEGAGADLAANSILFSYSQVHHFALKLLMVCGARCVHIRGGRIAERWNNGLLQTSCDY